MYFSVNEFKAKGHNYAKLAPWQVGNESANAVRRLTPTSTSLSPCDSPYFDVMGCDGIGWHGMAWDVM